MSDNEIDFGAVFDAYAKTQQRVWSYDRTQSLGASETFNCIRSGFFNKRGPELGFKSDEELTNGPATPSWGATMRGNLMENYFIVPAMKHMPDKYKMHFLGEDQETIFSGKNSATSDGLIEGFTPGPVTLKYRGKTIVVPNESDCMLIEFKTIDPRVFLEEEKVVHYGQVMMQLGLIRENTRFKPSHAVILYIDASFYDKIKFFVVTFDEKVYNSGIRRAATIYKTTDPMMLYPEGKFSGYCKYCKYTKACGAATANAIPKGEDDIDPDNLEDFETLSHAYILAKKEAEEAEKKKKEIGESIKEALLDHKRKRVTGGRYKIVWYNSKGNSSYDIRQMEHDGIDIEKYQRVGASYDILRVTPINGVDDDE